MPPTPVTEIDASVQAASKAFEPYATLPPERRSAFLEAIAKKLEALGDAWLQTAHEETHLPLPRLTGERGRTCAQLRMFADLLREGSWVDARVERADPDRVGSPKPDLRRMLVPIGPVVVFGASNFPFAFSVPGGDTASALAAGCPVIAKAHPSHPRTSDLASEAILAAARETGMPEGVFTLVHGGIEVGQALVLHPEVRAVAFTGSQKGGRVLFDLAASRERPIPVYAEMGSVNPVFLFPKALEERSKDIANGYADSLMLGVGQFCTNPGVVVGLSSREFDAFLNTVADRTGDTNMNPGKMLDEGIRQRYVAGVAAWSAHPGVESLAKGENTAPALFVTSAKAFLNDPSLREELFGPAAIAVRCDGPEERLAVAQALEGQLTATVHFADSELEEVRKLMPALVRMAGRIVANGFPTGVEVNAAQQHGGPYPAATDSRSTSVGTAAIERFTRPVAFQGMPKTLLPPGLQD
ncbi:aldehyde dehydrogenase (NADP(+)) [soil metagenome]